MTARLATVALVITMVVLAACSGEGDPSPSASGNAGATPSAGAATGLAGRSPSLSPGDSGDPSVVPSDEPDQMPDPRVEAALAQLDTDEALVGQLLLIGWAGDSAAAAREAISTLQPGGIVFIANASTAQRAAALNLGLDGAAAEAGIVPLLKAIDHEGGAIQRIDDIENVGSNLDFAATSPTVDEACARGATHARQLLEMGFEMNLAPVLDVNTNPNNPVIGPRSYGSRPQLVARLGSGYIRGLQAGGILAVGKHFPGHGDTSVDSHLDLPVLDVPRRRLHSVELVPFAQATAPDTGLSAVMTAHIALPRIDPSGLPATLSAPVIEGILRGDLSFDGLVISDDLAAMAAITDRFEPGQAAVLAIAAGVDMLIVGGDLERQRTMRDALVAALADGGLSRERVLDAVRHVLSAKARAGVLGGDLDPVPGC